MNDEARFAYLAEGNAKQARKRIAADVLVRDEANRVLLVNPTYKAFWDLPGGMAESNESPRHAAERELTEELGLTITIGRLLLLAWEPAHGPWDDQLLFLFDGGTLTPDRVPTLHILDNELDTFDFFTLNDATTQLRPDMANTLTRALHALTHGITDYTEGAT